MAEIIEFKNLKDIKNQLCLCEKKYKIQDKINDYIIYNATNNNERLISVEEIILNESECILKEEKRFKDNTFYDITYVKDGEFNLVGRYYQEFASIAIENSPKYILVYNWSFNNEKGRVTINKILSLYNKLDDTMVIGTYNELSKLFNNSTVNKQEFEPNDSSKKIYRMDLTRRIRTKSKFGK